MRMLYGCGLALGGWIVCLCLVEAEEKPSVPPPIPAAEAKAAEAAKLLHVELTTGGYKMYLNRKAAEKLRDALNAVDQEQDLAQAIREQAKQTGDAQEMARAELLAFVISKRLPDFRNEMNHKIGSDGVTIRVFGLAKPRKERPLLKNILRSALPPEVWEKVQKVMVMVHTTPIYWIVEPQGELLPPTRKP